MKRYISFKNTVLAAFLATASAGYSQSFQWARNFNNTSNDLGYSITTDADGNVLTTGFFDAQFDMITGTPYYSAGMGDCFIVKHAPNGNILWGKSVGGNQNDYGKDIATDADGNVYVTGSFTGTADFDPNAGVQQLTASGFTDIFLLKLDGNGNFLWVKQFGGTGWDDGMTVAAAPDGSVYFGGGFSESVSFGAGYDFTSYGYRDMFLAKLEADGDVLWVQHVGGGSVDDMPYSIAIDDNGDVLVGGLYMGDVDFDPSAAIVQLSGSGSFVEKLSPQGELIWVKGTDQTLLTALKADSDGNVIVTGTFYSNGPGWTTDFDPGPATYELTVSEEQDAFIQKLDGDGNFLWVKQIAGGGMEGANGIDVDRFGNIYLTGSFFNSVDFDPGPGSYELTSLDFDDLYILQLLPNGNFSWVKQIGGTCSHVGMALALDTDANILVTGYFQSGTDFNPDAPVVELFPNAGNDVFILKLGKQGNLGTNETLQAALQAWPNPNDGSFVLDLGKTYQHATLTITDANGNRVETQDFASLQQIPVTFNAPAGIYFLSVQTEEGNAVIRIVKE